MADHTPGPWTVILRGERGTFHIPEAQKHEAACANAGDPQDGYPVSSANARLIARAPELDTENVRLKAINAELVEALERCLVYVEMGYERAGRAVIVQSKAALKRAKEGM